MENVKSISCGMNHSAIVTGNGSLFLNGDGNFGQLGLGSLYYDTYLIRYVRITNVDNAKYVSCGDNYTAVLLSNNQIVTFGNNYTGQFGNNNYIGSNVPIYSNMYPGKVTVALNDSFSF